jgi:hypothetical protein
MHRFTQYRLAAPVAFPHSLGRHTVPRPLLYHLFVFLIVGVA